MSRIAMTPEQREQARRARTVERRTAEFAARMRNARSVRSRLSQACQYLRAVADDLPDDQIAELFVAVVQLAEEKQR